ncbi:BT_3987 domain-containing protein [Sunxiuqinia sp. A32]|uniref:BT_3987 domain-containing protein n=1 Tax=Sunxiuqinia sp. A32 TaxID=3461496 RepID=UPI0040465485
MNLKSIYLYLFFVSLCFLSVSCKDNIEIPGGDPDEYSRIYMSAAVGKLNVVTLQMIDSVQLISYGASFGGYGYPSNDIQVQFSVDKNLVDTYNLKNETNYPILPAESYELSHIVAVIPAGEVSTIPLHIEINPQSGLELFKTYLLPVSIRETDSEYIINEDLKTTYFLIQAVLEFENFPKYDRSHWSVLGVSSEEPNEGPLNGGVGMSAFDNNIYSFWHTKWFGGFATPPHWIAIDMGEVQKVHGLSIIGRQSNQSGKPKDILISVSHDGEQWIDIHNIQLANVKTEQQFFVSDMQDARFIKLTVLSTYGDVKYVHLAELYVF